jgi:4-hydroxy-2-oxoglutarate aldolase
MTPEVVARHYRAVADGSPVPVLLYNNPGVTGINLAPETLARLAEHPNIAGVKETGSDTGQVQAFVAAVPKRFAVIAGAMPTFYPSLCVGATGGILAVACVMPELAVRLYEHARAGRHDDARELQRLINPLARLVTTGFGVPGLKAAMDLAGYRGGEPRAPLVPLPSESIDQIRTALASLQAVAV